MTPQTKFKLLREDRYNLPRHTEICPVRNFNINEAVTGEFCHRLSPSGWRCAQTTLPRALPVNTDTAQLSWVESKLRPNVCNARF